MMLWSSCVVTLNELQGSKWIRVDEFSHDIERYLLGALVYR